MSDEHARGSLARGLTHLEDGLRALAAIASESTNADLRRARRDLEEARTHLERASRLLGRADE